MEDELTITEFLDVLRSRRSSYAFLSRMYGEEVSFALLSELANSKNLIAEEDATSEGHGILKEFARRLNESDLKTVETDLAAEYASLFLGAGSRPVFPYESVYTSEERLVMQKARDEVLSVYKQEGLDRSKEYNEPEDHIAIELEFMAYLCQKTIEAIEKGDKEGSLACLNKQKGFLEEHLMVWIPDFCDDLEQATESDFYKGIAKLTREHLGFEQETLGELMDEIRAQPDVVD